MPRAVTAPARRQVLLRQWRVGLGDYVQAVAWSPDGAWVAVAEVSGRVHVLAAANGRVVRAWTAHAFGCSGLAWRPDGVLLASAGQDGTARIWNVVTGEGPVVLEGGAPWVEHVAWSPSGDWLATAAGKQLRVWRPDGTLAQTYADHESTIAAIAWRPGVDELTSAAYGGIMRWRPANERPVSVHRWKGSVLAIAWSPDGRFIATGDQDCTMHFWVMKTGEPLQMWGYPTKVRELAWDAESRYLATGGGNAITVWDCRKTPEGTKPLQLEAHDGRVTDLAFQHRGARLASIADDGQVVLWWPGRHRTPIGEAELGGGLSRVAWSPDDRTVVVGSESGEVVAFDAHTTAS
ncbi:MAG TPA: WD40 repeat domain-containing protein [Gemmatimonadaceae bacterium]|jgi:WD40 repeat protein|nr:WD40 repeat domain-containing protein [Gemmatimonadaceae bacterium]